MLSLPTSCWTSRVGVLVQKFAPQYASRMSPEKAKQTFREVLKTSDFATKSILMSSLGAHLPKGVTTADVEKAVNEPSPAAEKPAAAAPAVEAPAAATSTPQPAVQAGAGPAAVAAATDVANFIAPRTAVARGPTAAAGSPGRARITPELMNAIKKIESGGNPNARTGSYKGLYQLSDSEFKRLGGRGNIFDPQENTRIAGLKLQQEADQVAKKLGRDLTPGEIYLVHQQGVGGAYEHLSNPNRPAWQSMHATGEGRSKGEGWSRLAIWGNVPDKDKAKYGSVDNLTSGEFTKMWDARVMRGGGGGSGEPKASEPLDPTPNVGASESDYVAQAQKEAAKSMVDPTPNVGAGESDYTAQAQAEAAKNMVDPTPNVGSGASDYPKTETPVEVASTLGKNQFGSNLGEALQGFGQAAYGAGAASKGSGGSASSTTVPMATLPTPPGVQPLTDPRVAAAQRQQLAMAMQRLNSGKLF